MPVASSASRCSTTSTAPASLCASGMCASCGGLPDEPPRHQAQFSILVSLCLGGERSIGGRLRRSTMTTAPRSRLGRASAWLGRLSVLFVILGPLLAHFELV